MPVGCHAPVCCLAALLPPVTHVRDGLTSTGCVRFAGGVTDTQNLDPSRRLPNPREAGLDLKPGGGTGPKSPA